MMAAGSDRRSKMSTGLKAESESDVCSDSDSAPSSDSEGDEFGKKRSGDTGQRPKKNSKKSLMKKIYN